MDRWLLFAGVMQDNADGEPRYYFSGWHAFQGDFTSWAKAREAGRELVADPKSPINWYHVVDTLRLRIASDSQDKVPWQQTANPAPSS